MQLVAINWNIFQLLNGTTVSLDLFGFHLSLNPEALGLGGVGLARIIPIAIFAVLGGALADVRNRRTLLIWTNAAAAVFALILAVLSIANLSTVWTIYVLTALTSATAAFSGPAFQSLVPNLVPEEHLTNAISLNSLSFQTATIAGPALAGMLMLFLFKDSCQHDGGIHYLFARWAWVHHELFVDVWSRPLFTLLYAGPALLGFRVARAVTVLVCLATAWQTYRLAEQLKLRRAPLAIALLFLQPSFFLFCADTMTEPLFALVFIIALRLHLAGRVLAGTFVASLFILTRPEGLFISLLWAVWVLRKNFGSLPSALRTPHSAFIKLLPLATGMFAWWLASWLITGDVLFIKHNWPANWPFSGTIYGAPGLLRYPARLPEIVGPLEAGDELDVAAVALVLTTGEQHGVLEAFYASADGGIAAVVAVDIGCAEAAGNIENILYACGVDGS